MRNTEFDREKVLRAAITAFMSKGYNKTSMPDLTQATGLHPGSIYAAFKNKRGLLIAAIGQYHLDRNTQFNHFFSGSGPILKMLKDYLDNIVIECLSCDAAQACLHMKTLSEIAEQDEEIRDMVTENLTLSQEALATKFEQAKARGELSTERDSSHLARYFMMGAYGLRTYTHMHLQPDTLQQLADQLYQDLCAA